MSLPALLGSSDLLLPDITVALTFHKSADMTFIWIFLSLRGKFWRPILFRVGRKPPPVSNPLDGVCPLTEVNTHISWRRLQAHTQPPQPSQWISHASQLFRVGHPTTLKAELLGCGLCSVGHSLWTRNPPPGPGAGGSPLGHCVSAMRRAFPFQHCWGPVFSSFTQETNYWVYTGV